MSHVAVIKCDIKSLEALKIACKRLGLEFKQGQTTYRWFGRWVNDYKEGDAAYRNGVNPENYGKDAIHAIGIPGDDKAYEIGVVQNRDSDGNPLPGFKLVWDFWSGGHGLEKYVGNKDASKLVAQYSCEAIREEAETQGYSVTETVDESGYIHMEMNDYTYTG